MTASANEIQSNLLQIKGTIPAHVTLVAVSKTHPAQAISAAYETGHRTFGENKVQELVAKAEELPKDISWHLIGHLQTNKVKFVVPFVSMIHAIDSEKLLDEVNKRARQVNRIIDVLLQVHIAQEETKFGFSDTELIQFASTFTSDQYPNIRVRGLMGMASFTQDTEVIRNEFRHLKRLFVTVNEKQCFSVFDTLSMGMSGDYTIAIEEGSNMIRLGSSIFGSR
ncbi:MAG: hypothetical protein RL226_1269 [Bacteroidota bacterium]|jgi:pyridoxal phosphate enzyme (YggS family)